MSDAQRVEAPANEKTSFAPGSQLPFTVVINNPPPDVGALTYRVWFDKPLPPPPPAVDEEELSKTIEADREDEASERRAKKRRWRRRRARKKGGVP